MSAVFIMGAQRSGTTALASCLNEAAAAYGGDFTINGKLLGLLQRWVTADDVAARHLRADEIHHALERRRPYGRGAEEWMGRVVPVLHDTAAALADGRLPPDVTAAGIRRAIVEASYRRGPLWGDKYNEYMLDLRPLAEIADAHLVLVVRHPHHVARSTQVWGGEHRSWRPATHAATWTKWIAWHEMFLAGVIRTGLPYTVILHHRPVAETAARLRTVCGVDLAPHTGRFVDAPLDAATIDQPLPAPVAELWHRLCARAQDHTDGKETPND